MELTTVSQSPFDSIRKFNEDGSEFWSARDLMPMMGYPRWSDFKDSVDRAKSACKNTGNVVAEHFSGTILINPNSNSGRNQSDTNLSRYGSYLVAMNGDPRKPEVASAQSYFAMRTHEAETKQLNLFESDFALLKETNKNLALQIRLKEIDLEALKIQKGIIVPNQPKQRKASAPPQPESIDLQELIATDSVAAWLNDCLRLDPDSKVYVGAATANPDTLLYPNYGRYCKQHRLELVTIQRFSRHLMSLVEATLGVKLGKQKDQKGNHVKGVAIGGSGNLLFSVLESIAINPCSEFSMIRSY